MEETLKLILGKLDNLEIGQKNLEAGMQRLEQRQDNLEAGMQRLEQRQDNLEAGQKELIGVVRNIEEHQQQDINYMFKVISKKMDHMATKNDIAYLAAKLGEHDWEIHVLKERTEKEMV